jgi:hypothetical protein
MVFEPLKFGRPYDSIRLNRLWNQVWAANPYAGAGVFEKKFARMWHKDAFVTNGGGIETMVLGADNVGRFPYHRYWYQSPPLAGDAFLNPFTLSAGTYDFIVLCRTTPDSGIIEWTTSSDDYFGQMNLYDATGADLVVKTITGVTITSSGPNLLFSQNIFQDPSSSGNAAYLYKYCFREQ